MTPQSKNRRTKELDPPPTGGYCEPGDTTSGAGVLGPNTISEG